MDAGRHAALRGVLFTDIVGSTELRQRLGDDRADALRRDHNALLGSAVTGHGGRVLRWTGDGVKADFASASAALAAAIDVQRAVAAYAERPGAVTPFRVRIGVSVGEVVVEADDAHGIAAIEAARLEPMAAPGEILATSLVQRLGHRRTDAQFEDVGSFALKGLDEPVTVVRVVDVQPASRRPLPPALTLDQRFPLVGRADELALAMARWQECRAGVASTVLVAGPPGHGKSRLVAQVADRAHADGALVLAGRCDGDLAVPYHPFAAALLTAAVADEELAGAVADGAGPLGRLFPSRRPAGPDDAAPSARFELFEAVVDLVDRLAEARPVVLVLDDLQWADPPSVQLLRHLLDRTAHDPLLVLATLRRDEAERNLPLAELLAGLEARSGTAMVSLAPLRRQDLGELVAARVPFAPAHHVDAFAARLLDESGGSPFFTCELLQHLSSTGDLARIVEAGAAAELPIPESVKAVVAQRLARLPEGVPAVLAAAAVIGATFDLELLAAVVERSEDDVLAVCEEADRDGLLQEVGIGRFAFAHAIVRAALLDTLSASRCARTHRKVAETIVALGRPDHDELARHWREAGAADRASESLELAARRDLDALAYESARERYEVLVDFHGGATGADVRALARAQLGLGLARRALAEPGYLTDVEHAARLGRRLGDVDIVADAAIASVWPGTFFHIAGEVPVELIELCEDALELLPDDDDRRVRVLATLASHLTFEPDRQRRVDLLAEADALARRTGDPELIGAILVAEHVSLWDPTTVERRREIAVEVRRMARASGSPELEFFGRFFAAVGAAERARLREAGEILEDLAEVVTATHNPYFAFLVERLLVSIAIATGEPGVQARVDALAHRFGSTHADTAGTWALQTGMLALQRGVFGGLVPTLRTMVEGRPGIWMAPFGMALVAAGEHDEAAALLAGLDVPPLDFFWLTTMQCIAELAVGVDDAAWQAACLDALDPFRDQLGLTASGSLCLGLVATSLGQLALAQGRADDAEPLLRDAVDRAEAMGAPYESVKARRLLATALRVRGELVESAALAASALADAGDRGFDGEVDLLAALAALTADDG